MNVAEDVAKKIRSLIIKEPFYGYLLMRVQKAITEDNQVAQTANVSRKFDSIDITLTVNSNFWKDLQNGCRMGVLKHEILHIVFGHLFMCNRSMDQQLFNIAADLEINQYIDKEYKDGTWKGIEINNEPFRSLNLPLKAGSLEYYNLLKKEIKDNPESDIAKMLNAFKQGGYIIKGTLSDGSSYEVFTDNIDWEFFGDLSDAEKKLIRNQIEHQIREAASEAKRQQGKLPGEIEDIIKILDNQYKPATDWKAIVRKFAGSAIRTKITSSYHKINKRFPGNPGMRIKHLTKLLVAIDTSGSVDAVQLNQFFAQIEFIRKSGCEVMLVHADTAVARVEKFKGLKDHQSVFGRGGTDFDAVIDYFNEHRNEYKALIYFTDGYASAPTSIPLGKVLWVFPNNVEVNTNLPGLHCQIN